MTTINLDNLSQDNRDRLQQRAAIHGRCLRLASQSLESELDLILTSVFEPKPAENSLKELLLAMPDVGEDEDFNRVRDNVREISL